MNQQNGRALTAYEAAKSLRVSVWLVYRLCRSGAILAQKRGGAWQISSLPTKHRFITPSDMAFHRGVSPQLIRRMICDGRISAVRIGCRKWAIPAEEAINLLGHPGFLRPL
jgi:predicted site-specific integrase-resolvase